MDKDGSMSPSKLGNESPMKNGKSSMKLDIDLDESPTKGRRGGTLEGDEKYGITNMADLKEIKFLLTSNAANTFNTNVLRIALNMHEEKIASMIIADYIAKVDEEMILRAVKTSQLDFL